MIFALMGACFAVSFAITSALVLRYAFSRSVGTGFMVLLVPAYLFVFAFSQFEHPRKSFIVSAFVASFLLAAICLGLTENALQSAVVMAQP